MPGPDTQTEPTMEQILALLQQMGIFGQAGAGEPAFENLPVRKGDPPATIETLPVRAGDPPARIQPLGGPNGGNPQVPPSLVGALDAFLNPQPVEGPTSFLDVIGQALSPWAQLAQQPTILDDPKVMADLETAVDAGSLKTFLSAHPDLGPQDYQKIAMYVQSRQPTEGATVTRGEGAEEDSAGYDVMAGPGNTVGVPMTDKATDFAYGLIDAFKGILGPSSAVAGEIVPEPPGGGVIDVPNPRDIGPPLSQQGAKMMQELSDHAEQNGMVMVMEETTAADVKNRMAEAGMDPELIDIIATTNPALQNDAQIIPRGSTFIDPTWTPRYTLQHGDTANTISAEKGIPLGDLLTYWASIGFDIDAAAPGTPVPLPPSTVPGSGITPSRGEQTMPGAPGVVPTPGVVGTPTEPGATAGAAGYEPGSVEDLIWQSLSPGARLGSFLPEDTSPYMRSLLEGNAAPYDAYATLFAAGSGQDASEAVLKDYYQQFAEAPPDTDALLASLSGLAGTGSEVGTNYLSNPNAVMDALGAVLLQRMGSYMFQNLMGEEGLQRLMDEYMLGSTQNPDQDLAEFLQAQGVI